MHSSYNLQSVRSMKYVQSVERQSLLETYVSVQSLLPVSPLKEVAFLKKNLSGNRMVLAFLVQNPLFPFACTCAIACAHTCTAYPPPTLLTFTAAGPIITASLIYSGTLASERLR